MLNKTLNALHSTFILAKSRSKTKEGATNSWFTKFPENVVASERLIGGDVNILKKDPFAEKTVKKIDYKAIFGSPKPVPKSAEKTPKMGRVKKEEKLSVATPAKSFSSPRVSVVLKRTHSVRHLQVTLGISCNDKILCFRIIMVKKRLVVRIVTLLQRASAC